MDKLELLSTESNATPHIDVTQCSINHTPKNKSWTSLEFFEKARKNKERQILVKEDNESKESCVGFWDNVTNFFNPFKCDKK